MACINAGHFIYSMNLTPETIKSLFPEVLRIALESGQIIREQSRGPLNISHKGPMDLVTQTDVAVEEFLIEKLGELDRSIAFLGEESTAKGLTASLKAPAWIIDPVDGTTNYAHRMPFVATSLALWSGKEVLLGIVNCPLIDECFYAVRGTGAHMGKGPDKNGNFAESTRLEVSKTKELSSSLLATGFPYDTKENLPLILKRMEKVLPATQGLRRFGAAALDLAYVAAGRFDAYYEEWLKPWDVAAGWLLVEEAKGRVGTLTGGQYTLESSGIVAANPLVYRSLLNLLA